VTLPGALRYQVLTGSRAYGLAGPGSDEDWRGFYQVPTAALFGLNPPTETVTLPPDQVYWELRHFAKLCLAGNPNIMDLLWIEPEFVTLSSPLAEALRRMRTTFFSSSMVAAYLGWAKSERLTLAPGDTVPGGEKRADLAGKRGSHLVRLLLGLRGALRDGEIRVRLTGPDLELVGAVKAGQVAAERVLAQVLSLEAECRALAENRAWGPANPALLEALLLAARRGEI
jgi:predicted nucleotidyltransferase